jgi:HK97 family phage major capsid protein
VPVKTARGFIPYSIEIGEDYPSFAAEMRRLLDEGYINLVAEQTMTGSSPTGIFTALDANTNVEVIVTTDGQFGAVDLLKVWKSLPERYRGNATWIMSTDVENEIRTFSANDTGAYYTVNLTQGGIGNLFGRPVRTTDYAPEFTGTTGAANILVVGDFANFLVAQRAGMSIEFIPNLFGATTGRPTGQRGWFAYARHGFDSINDLGFRILQND